MNNTIYAARPDGLGERLNSIFNAVALSKLTGIQFKVTWPQTYVFADKHHSVENIDQIFSKSFIEKHLTSENDTADQEYLTLPREIDTTLKNYLSDCIRQNKSLIPQSHILKRIDLEESKRKSVIASTIGELTFSKSVQKIKKLADAVKLPSRAAAIHYRAGDIIYGRFSEYPSFTGKVITAPTTALLIEKLLAAKSSPVLFGQDQHCIKALASRYSVIDASVYTKGHSFNRLEAAFFDIFLMSRCQEIYAGSSGFPRFSAQLADIEIPNIKRVLPPSATPEKILEEIKNHKDCYTNEQMAYTLFATYREVANSESPQKLEQMLDDCCNLSNNNVMFAIFRALNKFKSKKFDEADSLFGEIIDRAEQEPEKDYQSRFLQFMKRGNANPEKASYFTEFLPELTLAIKEKNSKHASLLAFFAESDYAKKGIHSIQAATISPMIRNFLNRIKLPVSP